MKNAETIIIILYMQKVPNTRYIGENGHNNDIKKAGSKSLPKYEKK